MATAVQLLNVRPVGKGQLQYEAEELLLVTPSGRWHIAAEAEIELPQIQSEPQIVTVAARVEEGVLGVGWHRTNDIDWVARTSASASDGAVELRLVIPRGTLGGKLLFDNWSEDGTAARAVITGIDVASPPQLPAEIQLARKSPEFQPAEALAQRGDSGMRCGEIIRGSGAGPFRTYCAEDAMVVGRFPGVFGLRRGGGIVWVEECVNHLMTLQPVVSQNLDQLSTAAVKRTAIASACLLDGQYSANLWHWLLEWLVKAVILEETGFVGSYLIPDRGEIFARSLEMIGVPHSRIIPHSHDLVDVEQLFFTQRTQGQFVYYEHPWLAHGLRERMLRGLEPGSERRRLFIARRGTRRVANEEQILPILEEYRFETVYMEDLPVERQVALAAAAEIIAGPHGAGLAHAVFMRQGGALIEMFSNEYVHPVMLAVCDALDLNYYMLTARKFPEGWTTFPDREILVDPELLRLTLRNAVRHLPQRS